MATVSKSERKAWARERFRGLENVTAPSFMPDMENLDEDGIRLDVQQAIKHGFFGTRLALEAGLTLEESRRFVQIAVEEAGDRLLVGVNILPDSFEDGLALLRAAEQAGAHYVALGYPQAFYPTPEDIVRVTREMCGSTNMGVMLQALDKFGFGRFHASGVPLDVYEQLVDQDNVVALHLNLLEPGLLYECFTRFNERALVGVPSLTNAPLLVTVHGQQWSGGWTIEAVQSPEKPYAVQFFDLLLKGQTEAAMPIYWQVLPALKSLAEQMVPQMQGASYFSKWKYYQWCVGGNGGYTRQPVMKLYERDTQGIRAAYRALGIEPREPEEEFFVGRLNYARGMRPMDLLEPALAV